MAGAQNSVPGPHGNMPEIDVADPFEKMNGLLGVIADALTGRDPTVVQWDLVKGVNVGQTILSQHVRFRSDVLVFAGDAAMAVTLQIGTQTWVFQLPGADTRVIPYGWVIERGTDVRLSASAGNITAAYLLGNRE